MRSRKIWSRLVATGAAAAVLALGPATAPASAATLVPVTGAGSTWSSNAMDEWIGNVNQYGIKIEFAPTGSSDGRTQFKNDTVDFGVSEIPYGVTDNGTYEPPPSRSYAYMPIVAGGTSFMYQLHINGKQVTNLRLSGKTIAQIFTGNITKWNDAAITADNPGIVLPAESIVPIVRSDGSGTTAQFTTWMSKTYPDIWNAYCGKAGRVTPCGVTSTYPVVNGYGFVAQQLSTGVASYITQNQSEGTIGYVETSYAIAQSYPVVKMLNAAGYYVAPTANNVAVALTAAQINTDASSPNYLTQVLDGVYSNPDPRTYPLSSYSYMIIPTAAQGSMNTNKGYTLGKFAYYFLCEGQQSMGDLGYSPLPLNLVQAAIDQVKKIPGVDVEHIDLSQCNNPTFDPSGKNLLAVNAPQPQACDKQSVTMCPDPTGGASAPTYVAAGAGPVTTAPPKAGTPTKAGGKKPPATTAATPTATHSGGPKTSNPPPAAGTGQGQGQKQGQGSQAGAPANGQPTAAGQNPAGVPPTVSGAAPPPAADPIGDGAAAPVAARASGAQSPNEGQVVVGAVAPLRAVPVAIASPSGWTFQDTLTVLSVVLFLLLILLPPLLARRLSKKSS